MEKIDRLLDCSPVAAPISTHEAGDPDRSTALQAALDETAGAAPASSPTFLTSGNLITARPGERPVGSGRSSRTIGGRLPQADLSTRAMMRAGAGCMFPANAI